MEKENAHIPIAFSRNNLYDASFTHHKIWNIAMQIPSRSTTCVQASVCVPCASMVPFNTTNMYRVHKMQRSFGLRGICVFFLLNSLNRICQVPVQLSCGKTWKCYSIDNQCFDSVTRTSGLWHPLVISSFCWDYIHMPNFRQHMHTHNHVNMFVIFDRNTKEYVYGMRIYKLLVMLKIVIHRWK